MKAIIDIVEFEVDDIITTSEAGGNGNLNNGGTEGETGDIFFPDPVANIYN